MLLAIICASNQIQVCQRFPSFRAQLFVLLGTHNISIHEPDPAGIQAQFRHVSCGPEDAKRNQLVVPILSGEPAEAIKCGDTTLNCSQGGKAISHEVPQRVICVILRPGGALMWTPPTVRGPLQGGAALMSRRSTVRWRGIPGLQQVGGRKRCCLVDTFVQHVDMSGQACTQR